MTNNCIFCKIKEEKIPSHKIYEDEKCFAILDKFPGTEGQTLVISNKHEPFLFDLDNETYTHIFEITKYGSKALQESNEIRNSLFNKVPEVVFTR